MIESHVNKLTKMATLIQDEEQRGELLRLAEEEGARARKIRQQVVLLRDHLDEESPLVAWTTSHGPE